MYNKYKNYFAERGLNIFFTDKAVSISCLNSYLTETQKEKTLCLVASGGKSLWEKLPSTAGENPIDDYTLETIHHLNHHAEILFPNDQYLLPLQQIGRHFNFCHPTPMGPDISKDFGPWFGLRAVFLIDQTLPTTHAEKHISPCESCHKPCLAEKEFHLARRLCPIHQEQRYSPEQENYYISVLKREISRLSK